MLPLLIFLLFASGSYAVYTRLHEYELSYAKQRVRDEAQKIEFVLNSRKNAKLQALERMARRWEVAGGTRPAIWRTDARRYTEEISGLKAIEWVDSSYHVRWVEPVQGNEKARGLNVLFDEQRRQALKNAARKTTPTVTPPLELVQGYTGFIAYVPLRVEGKFGGFLAGIFSIEDFLGGAITEEIANGYAVSLYYKGKAYFTNDVAPARSGKDWAVERSYRVYDKLWTVRVAPSTQAIERQETSLPLVVLLAGLLIGALSALVARYLLVSRQISEYLLELNRLSSAILSSTTHLVIATDETGTIVIFNKAAEAALGYDADEVVGKETPALWHDGAEVAQRASALSAELETRVEPGFEVFIRKPLLEGSEVSEWTVIRRDGSRFPVLLTVTPLNDAGGDPVGYLGVIEDITERKEQQQALRASAEQLRLLVEHTPAAVAMFDRRLTYLMTSRRWIQDYGLEGREVIGKTHYEVFPELLAEPGWVDIHQRALGGEVFDMQESSWVRESGKREWIKWAVHPWIDNAGEVGGIVMFSEVITARKEAEEALRLSEETFRAAMEHAPIGMVLVSRTGRWLQVNPALCRLLGYSKEELLEKDFQSITYPDDLEPYVEALVRLLLNEINACQLEKRYYHKSGRLVWTLLSVSLMRRADGEPDFLIAQIQDISERKEMERMKNEFISVVSHELRTPLTSIRGSLGLVLGALSRELSAKVKELIGIAHNNCERLILLINDILDIDKIASGHMRFASKRESLAELTRQAVEDNLPYARGLNAHIALTPIDEGVEVEVDASRYIQVLSNLLSNAAKFSPPGETITVAAELRGEWVRISVTDNGIGIAEEFRPRIFGRFSQADASASRAKGGTGLGLHISKQLVERMHGRIGYDTKVGEGTTFWVEFPTAGSRRVAGSAGTAEPARVLPKPRSVYCPEVLHVEDDADLSDMLGTALQDKATIISVTTLQQAEELLRQRNFAMILLDVKLPDGSGLRLLERLNSLAEKPPPVVILAADSPPPQVYEQVAAVMVKTRTSEPKLVEAILEVLERRQLEA